MGGGGGKVVTNSKVWGSCQTAGPIATKCGTHLQIHLGMDNTPNKLPLETQGGTWGGLGVKHSKVWEARVPQIQKYEEPVKRLDRLALNVAQICRSIWEWIHAKQIAPRYTRGGGVSGQTFRSLGKLSNGWTDWHQLWFTSADSSGNGHRLYQSRPSIPQGAFGRGRGSQIRKSGEAVKWLERLAPNSVHVCRFVWEWT